MSDIKEINEFTGIQRVGVFFANWALLIGAPLWAPIAFWGFAITGKGFLKKLCTGKNLISE